MAITKIATCCYCGTKAALVLRGKARHELACASCGAPLHVMKMLPLVSDRVTAPAATPTRPRPVRHSRMKDVKRNKPGKWRKSKGFGRKLMENVWEEVWDALEDVFD